MAESASTTPPALDPHYPKLKGYFGRRVPCPQEAADLTQETFFRVLTRKQNDTIKDPLRLLFRVARNLLIDRSRRFRTRPEITVYQEREIPSGAASPSHVVEARDELGRLRAAIETLPPRCREVFILNRFEGLSYAEVAARLGISPKTVEKHMARAILTCRAAMERE